MNVAPRGLLRGRAALPIVAALALSACATSREFGGDPHLQLTSATELPAPSNGPQRPGDAEIYRIGPGDQLMVGVFGIQGLEERQVNVDESGALSFPIAGTIDALGMTPTQLTEALAQRLRGAYIRDPQVTVNVKERAPRVFSIDGQVTRPGIYPVDPKSTLIRAVAAAGSTNEFARLQDVVVFRTVENQRYAALYDLRAIREGKYPDPRIYPDDVIVVGESSAQRLIKNLVQVAPGLLSPLVVLFTN
jgi:polysaccharide biosynthesis/export protein